MQTTPLYILNKYWKYDYFRPLQEEIIKSVLDGNDTLALLPTGGGKSITFQVPALINEGVCLVITPLIALMKDQVNGLQKIGIKAEAIYTGLTNSEIKQIINKCLYANVKLLYISPERANNKHFRQHLANMNISMITVDEAHCISQWGHDFRPSYLKIYKVRELFPKIPVLAVTATATHRVVDDIKTQLHFKSKNVFKTSFERPNLSYIVRDVEDKLNYLLRIVNRSKGSIIIYTRSRRKTKEIHNFLAHNNISSTFFHAGLSNIVKTQRQNDWTNDKIRVIIATNAFGMGIDKSNVRVVVHIDLPDSIEAYFQEAGRAGRDGKPSYAILLYHKKDSTQLLKTISKKYPKKEIILRTYSALCNFLSIGEGDALGKSFPVNIGKFVSMFNLNLNYTFSSLAILRSAGVINFIEELDNYSRIIFRLRRDDLYQYQASNTRIDNFIKTILRMYSGLFTDYVPIDEYNIAKKLGISEQQTKELLIKLSRDHIIHYIPRIRSPYVSFPNGRLPESYINLAHDIYKGRKKQYKKQVKAVINYAQSKQRCRSQILLTYFDDYSAKPCKQCDTCLSLKTETPSKKQLKETAKSITEKLTKPCKVTDLEAQFDNNGLFHSALFWLLDNEEVKIDTNNTIELC